MGVVVRRYIDFLILLISGVARTFFFTEARHYCKKLPSPRRTWKSFTII